MTELTSNPDHPLAEHWRTFRQHVPTGAYLPTGHLDGDCRACGTTWPCPPVQDALAAARMSNATPSAETDASCTHLDTPAVLELWERTAWLDAPDPGDPTATVSLPLSPRDRVLRFATQLGVTITDRAGDRLLHTPPGPAQT